MRLLACLILACLLAVSCAGKGQRTEYGVPPGSPCPEWYTNVPEDPDFFFSAATATSRDLQLAVDKAKTDARAEIARQLEVHISGLTKKFDEEVGLSDNSNLYSLFMQATKMVVDQTLRGTTVKYQHTTPEKMGWRACVLVQCSKAEANAQLVDRISNNEELYTRFRASQAFKELEKEVEAYRKYKEEQGF